MNYTAVEFPQNSREEEHSSSKLPLALLAVPVQLVDVLKFTLLSSSYSNTIYFGPTGYYHQVYKIVEIIKNNNSNWG
jgi:hypothetical protein